MKAIQPDKQQTKAINSDENTIVISGPGSGKTFTLINKAYREVRQNNSVLALTFTRASAAEIKYRAPKVYASTIHSLCYSYVKPSKEYFNDTQAYFNLLWDFLSYENKPVFDWILIDECMDLNELELEVIKSMVTDKTKVFAIGDHCQHIFQWAEYPWTESKLQFDAVKEIKEQFNCKKMTLNNNYRSGQDIVKKIERIHLRGLVSRGPNERVKGTALLFRTNRQLSRVAEQLSKTGHPVKVKLNEAKYPGSTSSKIAAKGVEGKEELILATIHCSKGLQFEKVLVFNWGEKYQETNLYYVACSRASKFLYEVESFIDAWRILNEKSRN